VLHGVGQIGSVLEGALKGLMPNTPGPSVPPNVVQAMQRMMQNLQSPAGVTAMPEAPDGSKEDMLRYQQMFEMMSKMLQSQSDMAKSAIQNLR
jgi:hypothetical protein